MPCADEVWRLHNVDEPDCVHFRKFCDEGGPANGGRPGDRTTRQGTYCCTPSGMSLGHINHRDPNQIKQLLKDALKKWKEIKKKDRLLDYDPEDVTDQITRSENQYPEDGLVLKSYSRDLERKGLDESDWRTHAWNFDFVWFRRAEVEEMLPGRVDKKTEWDFPEHLTRRVYRIYFRDNVRGQTGPFPEESIEKATLKCKVKKLRKGIITYTLEGEVKMVDGERGVEGKILGEVEYNTKKKQFDKFELVMAGERWGRTQYNARQDDTDRAPVGYVMKIAEDKATEKVAPSQLGAYSWR